MSLSPLYAAPGKDLHVTTAAGLHQPFGGLRRGRAKITAFRVCAGPLGCSRRARPGAGAARGPAQLLDPCFETGERGAGAPRRPPRPGPGQRVRVF